MTEIEDKYGEGHIDASLVVRMEEDVPKNVRGDTVFLLLPAQLLRHIERDFMAHLSYDETRTEAEFEVDALTVDLYGACFVVRAIGDTTIDERIFQEFCDDVSFNILKETAMAVAGQHDLLPVWNHYPPKNGLRKFSDADATFKVRCNAGPGRIDVQIIIEGRFGHHLKQFISSRLLGREMMARLFWEELWFREARMHSPSI